MSVTGGTLTIPSESPVHNPVSIVPVAGSGDLTVVLGIILRGLLTTVSRLQHWGVVAMAIGVSCDCCIDWTKNLGVMVA